MSGYVRTTRECPVTQVQPGLYQAIWDYFQKYQLGDVDTEVLKCCETISEERNAGRLSTFLDGHPDKVIRLALLLTTDWLIWAASGDQSGIKVNGARLFGLKVKVFVARRSEYMQLEITGIIGNTKEYVRGTLELGPELAAQKFCEEVGKAVLEINPPVKRKFLGLMGG
jgi:hypothetical protein